MIGIEMRKDEPCRPGRPGQLGLRRPRCCGPIRPAGRVLGRGVEGRVIDQRVGPAGEGGQPFVGASGTVFRVGGEDDGPAVFLDSEGGASLGMMEGGEETFAPPTDAGRRPTRPKDFREGVALNSTGK